MSDRLPSPSGARLSGDDYQHAVTWLEALLLLQDDEVTQIRFEVGAAEAGIVDDLVIHRKEGIPATYRQIKFGVDDRSPLTSDWFLTPPSTGARTPLKRFYESFEAFSDGGGPTPELELFTARQTDPRDPLLPYRSNLDGKLTTRQAGWSAEAEAEFERWREHLGVSEEELQALLDHLKISPGRGSLEDVLSYCRERMGRAGLKADEAAVVAAVGIIRSLIERGTFELDADDLRELVERYDLTAPAPRATLLIQELDRRPGPEFATASVDWVDDYIGVDRDTRRRPRDDQSWTEVFQPDLHRAAEDIRGQGFESVFLDGDFRLPTAFAVGRELNERSGADIVVPIGIGGEWSSAEEPTTEATPAVRSEVVEIDGSSGVAVAVSISADIRMAVETHLSENPETAGRLLVIEPESGLGRRSVTGAGSARLIAESIVDNVRAAVPELDEEVHLFLACPRPLAVFLGRVWNRAPSGWIYADLSPGYAPSYRI